MIRKGTIEAALWLNERTKNLLVQEGLEEMVEKGSDTYIAEMGKKLPAISERWGCHENTVQAHLMMSYSCHFWKRTKVVYYFSEKFLQQLAQTEDAPVYVDVLKRLPFRDFIMPLPAGSAYDAVFVHVDFENSDTLFESRISEKIQKRISETSSAAKTLATKTTQEAADAINSVVADQSEEAKKKAIQAVNQFIDTQVNSVADQISDVSNLASSGQSFSGSSAVSHAISFGYSDYLRLMIFMGLSTGKNDILLRTADLIERNINYPNQAVESEAKSDSFFGELFRKISWFFGNTEDGKTAAEKKWQMSKAYTYVQIDADIDMDMFFMKTTLFQNWMNAGMAEVGADAPDMTLTKSTYHYHSVMRY